jgi:hypothetical protein
MRRCMSVLGFTKSLGGFVRGGIPSRTVGLAMTGAPPIPRFTGMVLLWSMPAVLRIEGLSACGSNLGMFDGITALLSELT